MTLTTNPGGSGRRLVWWVGAVALAVSAGAVAGALDPADIAATWDAVAARPLDVALVAGAYGAAFVLRALVWQAVLSGLSFGHALAGLHVSLGANHVLPFRLGEALRVTSVARRTAIGVAPATASTVMLRAADVLSVVGLAAVLGPRVAGELVGGWGWALLVPAGALWGGALWWLSRLDRAALASPGGLGRSLGLVAAGATAAWVLEATVMWKAAAWAGITLDFGDAVLVTAVTIVAQSVAVAPAGIGTYEAAAGAALVALGAGAGPALAAAVAAHALKTVYALLTGAVASFVPSPGLFGRLRLPASSGSQPASRGGEARDGGAPVVMFMPAYDEAESIGALVRRVPESIRGHPVSCLVVDDGSSDATAEVAARAGAEVLSYGSHRGLGFAVRFGLAAAARREPAAIAFCDADGEYRPEELERVVEPILTGRADYVVGSRLKGDIRRMLWHRRIGNVVLTWMLSWVARRRISDGQSGYRAFSSAAARRAEIVHDFNYAQVLTLDLLAKGFRYEEVPITYTWRTAGRSFVRLGRYLRHVLPAVHLELNSPPREEPSLHPARQVVRLPH